MWSPRCRRRQMGAALSAWIRLHFDTADRLEVNLELRLAHALAMERAAQKQATRKSTSRNMPRHVVPSLSPHQTPTPHDLATPACRRPACTPASAGARLASCRRASRASRAHSCRRLLVALPLVGAAQRVVHGGGDRGDMATRFEGRICPAFQKIRFAPTTFETAGEAKIAVTRGARWS